MSQIDGNGHIISSHRHSISAKQSYSVVIIAAFRNQVADNKKAAL
ncbi:hypothetical protein [Vibrio xiamenensis]|nr:hypothetical protein [Vibrio xiamenensis]